MKAAILSDSESFREYGITSDLYARWPCLSHGMSIAKYNQYLDALRTILPQYGKRLSIGKWDTGGYREWLKGCNLPDLMIYAMEFFSYAEQEIYKPPVKPKASNIECNVDSHEPVLKRNLAPQELGYRLGHFTTDDLNSAWVRLQATSPEDLLEDESTQNGASFFSHWNCPGNLNLFVTIIPSERHARFSSLKDLESEIHMEIRRRARSGFLEQVSTTRNHPKR